MNKTDLFLQRIHFWIRSKSLLYRFTLGTRVLLAVGFIPTGFVKLLGHRFAYISLESNLGMFFEILYQSGLYWQFLGLTQVLAGVLILIPATSALGALLFFGIILNIFIITLSYDFAYTPVITFQMLLASIWLLLWEYDRFRSLIFDQSFQYENISIRKTSKPIPRHTLENSYERAVYITGTVAGLLFFGMMRGLALPAGFGFILLSVCMICFISAIVFGLRNISSKPL